MARHAAEKPSSPAAEAKGGRQLEFHQLELTYQATRASNAKRRAQLVASICEHGQQSPVVVVELADQAGRYVLIDGYQRVAALQKLGHDTVAAVVLPLNEVEALCLTHRLQVAQQRSPLEQGWLLSELVERHGVSQAKLATLLGHAESWVSRRLALVRELPKQAHDLVRKGRLCPYGAMRHLVPLARAKRRDCANLVERLSEAPTAVSARQLGRLAAAWRSADTAERKRIVQQPLLYLRAEEAAATPAATDPPSPEQRLRNDLDALGAIARRASRCLDEHSSLARCLPLVFDNVWRQTQLAFDDLQQRMEGRLNAGPGHTKGHLRAQEEGSRQKGHREGAEDLEDHGQGCPG
jgi:ParB family chromosome partitioning protein